MTRRFAGRRAQRAARHIGRNVRRNGSALFLVLFFMGAVGTLALSAIYVTGNANATAASFDKESQLKYAAEAGLALGKARLNFDPGALPNTSYVALYKGMTLLAADNTPIQGVTVNVYAGQTGSTSGQFGRFASVVAEARDAQGTGFVRRLELTQESFAKYAYWSNLETNSGSPIYFANGDALWGPVWSNDVININTSGSNPAVYFHDVVGTAKTISGISYGSFSKGYSQNQKAIVLPSTSTLATLSGLATAGGFNFTPPTTGDQTTVRARIEFLATDINGTGDSTAANDGFFRYYTAIAGQTAWLRGDWPATTTVSSNLNCGDWFNVAGMADKKFFPIAVHPTKWFRVLIQAGGLTNAAARAESSATVATIMQEANARCYSGGDPHLVSIARLTAGTAGNVNYYNVARAGYALADGQKGGDDTTFSATDPYGAWTLFSNSPNAAVSAKRSDAKYLFELYRGYNTNTKGVIYAGGTIGVSGVVGAQVTLYSPNTVVILDDIRYAVDPAVGTCTDVLGLISGANTVVADNALNTPQTVKTTNPSVTRSLDDTKDLYIHGVIMALGTSFTVENYDTGPTAVNNCGASVNGRGCIYLTGGVIQASRGAVGTSTGTGFAKQYTYDRCAAVNPPPYFPTTGVFTDNKYYELDPVNFSVANLYTSLTPH